MKIESKSRYEVIASLEQQKRDLMRQRDSFPEQIRVREIEIKQLKRQLEDKEEALVDFKANVADNKKTVEGLIASVDDSLKRFEKMNSSN